MKLKEAGQSAGTFVGEVAKDAKGNVADVAEKVGSAVKTRWAILREPSTRHAMQERLITAAATTGMFFRKGISETKDKVTVGKTKVEEVFTLAYYVGYFLWLKIGGYLVLAGLYRVCWQRLL